ncbi:MAG: type II toxin-antitoxin system VapC family toxin [Syntrophobacteraceae bacterium]
MGKRRKSSGGTNALYRLAGGTAVTFEEIAEFLDLALGLEIHTVSEEFLHRKALLLANSCGLKSAYDAHYLALAQSLGTDFWTADRRLANDVAEMFPWVRFLGAS